MSGPSQPPLAHGFSLITTAGSGQLHTVVGSFSFGRHNSKKSKSPHHRQSKPREAERRPSSLRDDANAQTRHPVLPSWVPTDSRCVPALLAPAPLSDNAADQQERTMLRVTSVARK